MHNVNKQYNNVSNGHDFLYKQIMYLHSHAYQIKKNLIVLNINYNVAASKVDGPLHNKWDFNLLF